ncbi:stress-associated endoplasmic reticulum 2-like [Olea europaea subsp. europaea]|uniref:Stress-associated endoplasmic reticulum 2-like n=1 Tax=Olea europaea subsp. europaea TaxID=158383 RepID=A0A8S0VAN4_OLEEU|nr:stress-associated endoplasmic reticulum 2-like [Olea europaea subsp. europaea]
MEQFAQVCFPTPLNLDRKKDLQTTSKRLAEKKTAKFEKNITRRGLIPQSSKKEEWEPAHIVLVLFAVLVVLSFVYQVVRMAINGGMY